MVHDLRPESPDFSRGEVQDGDAKVIHALQEMRTADRVEAFRAAGWVPLAFHEAAVQAAYQAGREAERGRLPVDAIWEESP